LPTQFGGVTSGASYLTNIFDALYVGWREEGSQATAIDINSIGVSSSSIVTLTNFVSLNPIKLVFQVSGNQLQLSCRQIIWVGHCKPTRWGWQPSMPGYPIRDQHRWPT
jgi:hypothetical protein